MNRPKNSFRALSYTQQAQESLAATMSLSDIITSWADCYKTPNIELQTSNFEKRTYSVTAAWGSMARWQNQRVSEETNSGNLLYVINKKQHRWAFFRLM